MSLSNPDTVVTEQRLHEFYTGIYPYLNGAAHAGFTPVATIISVFGEIAPANYLICDGATYNKSDYPELAAHLLALTDHSQYEVSGDSTTFKVPDLRGEYLRGTGTNSHANSGNGADVGVHQNSTSIPMFWVRNDGKLGFRTTPNQQTIFENSDKDINTVISSAWENNIYNKDTTVETGGKTDSLTVRPTNTSVLFCIATKNIYVDARYDYSLDEKVVGTWIDGKPLYQRTFSASFGTITDETISSVTLHDFTGENYNSSINTFGSCYGATINSSWGAGGKYFIRSTMSGYNLICETNRSIFSDKTVYVTIQYTKTTD